MALDILLAAMPDNHLTLTRQTLYDLVWSKPMSTLAREFGISDVGLAKRCRAVDVPIPYRGYWARKTAGQNPPRLPLPKYRTRTPPASAPTILPAGAKPVLREGPEPTVKFGVPAEPPAAASPPDPSTYSIEQRIEALHLKYTAMLAETCAIVRRTAKHNKLPGRGALPLTAAERAGSIIERHVSKDTLPRALLLADLLRLAGSFVHPCTPPAPASQPRGADSPPGLRPLPRPCGKPPHPRGSVAAFMPSR